MQKYITRLPLFSMWEGSLMFGDVCARVCMRLCVGRREKEEYEMKKKRGERRRIENKERRKRTKD